MAQTQSTPNEDFGLMLIVNSVVEVGIAAYVLIAWYLWQRHVYKGPKINAELQNELHHEMLHDMCGQRTPVVVGVEPVQQNWDHDQKVVKGD